MNRRRSYSEYLTMILSLRKCQSELSIGRTGTVLDSTKWRWNIGYVEKKSNLLGSVVGLTVWVRPLSRHTNVETFRRWDKPTDVDQYWIRRTPEMSE